VIEAEVHEDATLERKEKDWKDVYRYGG